MKTKIRDTLNYIFGLIAEYDWVVGKLVKTLYAIPTSFHMPPNIPHVPITN